ncbi:MAG: aminoglycoside 3'-phosphotransferase/choline kinase family protein [Alphaproteobacteria bacterium]|nr:aminoglycoside 3'-phosphotransferase/choline kinase family protein [Alphaproteobacteria bacterium]
MFGDLDSQGLAALRCEPARWLPRALDIARTHGLPSADPHVFAGGTNLVVGLGGEIVLKIFPPLLRHQFDAERLSLRLLQGQLSVEVPRIVAEGELEDWPYLAMTRVQGATGEEVWPTLDDAAKERLIGRIGEVIAEVQRVPPGELAQGLDDYVRDAAPLIPCRPSSVILTGEYIPENFILRQDTSGWQLAGLIDFGDVMTGWGPYDVLGPGVFMAEGRPERVRALLRGFGYSEAERDETLAHRLFALCLLHRYSNPLRQFRVDGWQRKAGTLRELEGLIWPMRFST